MEPSARMRLWLAGMEEASLVRPVWWRARLFPNAGFVLPLLPFLQQGLIETKGISSSQKPVAPEEAAPPRNIYYAG